MLTDQRVQKESLRRFFKKTDAFEGFPKIEKTISTPIRTNLVTNFLLRVLARLSFISSNFSSHQLIEELCNCFSAFQKDRIKQ